MNRYICRASARPTGPWCEASRWAAPRTPSAPQSSTTDSIIATTNVTTVTTTIIITTTIITVTIASLQDCESSRFIKGGGCSGNMVE